MKPLTAFLCIMVVLSLAFSITAFAMVAQNNGFFAPSNPTPPLTDSPTTPPTTSEPGSYIKNTPTPSPKPTPTQPPTEIAISYTQTSKENITSDTTQVAFTLNLTYESGSKITESYSKFYLQLYSERMRIPFDRGTRQPQNSGTFTVGPSDQSETIQLTFKIPTTVFNGMDIQQTNYRLMYNGAATMHWADTHIY
jgi:hypothetical protein